MRIVLLSHTDRAGVFRVGSHHLAREFAALGHQVVHISNPISIARIILSHDEEARRRMRMAFPPSLHLIDGAKFAVPWSLFPLTPDPLGRCVSLGSTTVLRRKMAQCGMRDVDVMFVDQPLLHYLIDQIGAESVMYRATDTNHHPKVREAQARVLGRADGLIATSEAVIEDLGVAQRHPSMPTTVIANGVDLQRFHRSPMSWRDRSGAVYVGALDQRFDWAALSAMALSEPAERFDIYGPPQKSHPSLPPNVTLRGPVSHDDLPDLLAGYRVGLLPLTNAVTNEGRSPMKLFEYLATGMAVVARGTRYIRDRPLSDVHAYAETAAAADAFGRALRVEPVGDGFAAAMQMGWRRRAELVLEAAARFRSAAGGCPR